MIPGFNETANVPARRFRFASRAPREPDPVLSSRRQRSLRMFPTAREPQSRTRERRCTVPTRGARTTWRRGAHATPAENREYARPDQHVARQPDTKARGCQVIRAAGHPARLDPPRSAPKDHGRAGVPRWIVSSGEWVQASDRTVPPVRPEPTGFNPVPGGADTRDRRRSGARRGGPPAADPAAQGRACQHPPGYIGYDAGPRQFRDQQPLSIERTAPTRGCLREAAGTGSRRTRAGERARGRRSGRPLAA
jgi:hypothetical protein